MEELTEKQSLMYNTIKSYILHYGYSPTFRELCIKTGIKSVATIDYYLKVLKSKGYIDYEYNKNRTMRILK